MTAHIRPGPGRIAVVALDPSQEHKIPGTELSLWIPTSSHNEGLIGKVVAVCEPYQSDSGVSFAPNYSIGQIIVVGKFTGTRLNVGRETYTILFEKDVLAEVVTDEPAEP